MLQSIKQFAKRTSVSKVFDIIKNTFFSKSQESKSQKFSIFLLRIAIGWFFLYSGITKVLNPEWSAAGFLGEAQTFSGMYEWFSSAGNIGWVNFINSWGQFLIGLGLVAGAFTRLASFFGILMMILYYFPGLDFPYIGHGFLIDDHVIYILIFVLLITFRAGQYWGVDMYINKKIQNWWI